MNVPKLRFKEFNDEWNCDKIENLFNISAGGDIDSSHVSEIKFDNFIYPIYSNSLSNKGLYGYSDLYKVDGKTITITGRGDVGYAIDRNEKYYPIVRLLVLKPKYKIDNKFFAYSINNLNLYQESTGVPQLTAPQLGKYKIFYPQYNEQKKIADILKLLDKKIELQTKKIEDLNLFKKGFLNKFFKDKNTNAIIENCIDYGKSGGTPSSTNKEYYDGNIPFLSISDITNQGKYIYSTEKTISQKGLDNSSAWLVPKNCLILSMYASYGLVAINKIELSTSQAMFNMIVNKDNNTEYIYYYMEYLYENNYYDKLVSTGTQANLNADKVKKIKVYLPNIEEQNRIANLFISIDNKANFEKNKLNCLIKLKKGLMQNMFV